MTARRALRLAPLAALLALGAAPAVAGKAPAGKPAAEVRHPEDLFIVDCLLPGKVRSLGRYNKIATPRKVVRTSAHECGLRGGEWSQDLQDNAWALQSWQAQAEAGDAEAMNNVGEIYEQGVRGAPDFTLAAAWYRKAAEAGSRRGQRNLAALYEQGLGVEASDEQAVAWYRKAAGLTGEVELSAEKEAAALRAELEQARAEAAAAQGELARLQGELDGARAALAAAEQSAAAAKRQAEAAAAAAGQRAKNAEQLAVAEAEVAARRQRVAELEGAQDRFRTMLAELEASEQAARKTGKVSGATLLARRAPAIEFVRPDVLATRGPALAPVEAGAREAEVVGRVTAELGVASFTVDGRAESLDARGYFRVRLPVRADSTVRFVALDRAARRAEAELRFVAQGAPPPAPAPPPGGAAPPAAAGKGKRYALVLANGSYRALPGLRTARADGEALARVLGEEYGFQVKLLEDAGFLDTMLALDEIARALAPGDDLLVYFAGHGRIDEASGRGYWLPADADPQDRTTWLPNDALARRLGTVEAGHVLVVSDSCYAGTLAASGLEATKPAPGAGRSRTVLASGGLQPVLDEGGGDGHSIFARALLSVLQLARGATPASAVASAVAARVGWKSAQLGAPQTPVYAPIRHAGHESGDFVFVPRG
jgi:hypothetical protein